MLYKKINMAALVAMTVLQGCGGSGDSTQVDPEPTPIPTPVPDTTAPIITLLGDAQVNHEQGTNYVDAGATANDETDGNIAVSVAGEVGLTAGSYTLTYTATDNAGNSANISRAVFVADTTAPIITLNGAATIDHTFGEEYLDAGATATDLVDGTLNVITSGEVASDIGSYSLTYTATDAANNSASVIRTVNVVAQNSEQQSVTVFTDGIVGDIWTKGISAFDSAIGWGECNNDGGTGCPSISWQITSDDERGDVLAVTHAASGDMAGLFIGSNGVVDLSNHTEGKLLFDIKVVTGDSKMTIKLDCIYPCTSGDQALGSKGASAWETVEVSLQSLADSGLDLAKVNTGIVIWATEHTDTQFYLDNVRFEGIKTDDIVIVDPGTYNITQYGAGSVSDTINPDSYRCVYDYGNWIYNAGIVEPAIAGCDTTTGKPSGTPTKLYPHLTGAAAQKPTPTHKWWGSVPFMGEMRVGDANNAAYITPDPITARITEKGVRIMGIPSGLSVTGDGFLYPIPDPFSEVFDGIAIGNSQHSNMDGYLKDHSDSSVTIEWQSGDTPVMQATFVHGSPFVFFEVYEGKPVIRTLREDGGEKGTFYDKGNSLGIWTSVAGNHNNFLITGEGETQFINQTSDHITIENSAKQFTLAYLPQTSGIPNDTYSAFFEVKARNVVASTTIAYEVNQATNEVTISHRYFDSDNNLVDTIVGLLPLHWKNTAQATSSYQVRSARGVIKFSETNQFSYSLPFVGVLPSLPDLSNSYDETVLNNLVNAFVDQDQSRWNTHEDAYWSGKNYNKVAELIAITDAAGLTEQSTTMRDWLKAELADWFTAETEGSLDENKYFVYDEQWNTLLAMEESFMSHQQLNDHHFHYGYIVRAAAEICRTDPTWCSSEQYGPMVELLIRDYAGGRDDPMFPYLRNFDPANGFSWASGKVNFARGNNNESTSEAANAYGAIVLYGLITNNKNLVDRGIYLHASTTASYWEYWNNIDRFNNIGQDADNFPTAYNKLTTSIIWGDGAVFSTWFSAAYAHILGIQGLPTNPLTLHVGLHADYMKEYVTLGLAESSNAKPSGLPDDQWRDIWWNLWAMTDATAAIADYDSVTSYDAEAGETKAHTYHWLKTFEQLGHLATGTGELTADYPAAMAFVNGSVTTYVIYNFSDQPIDVTYSNGEKITASGQNFTVVKR